MKPHQSGRRPSSGRRFFLFSTLVALGGCGPLVHQPAGPDNLEAMIDQPEPAVTMVGELTSPEGMKFVKVQSVALITELNGTGSDPRPSPRRDRLIGEMQTHDVKSPTKLLRSNNNSLALVVGYLRPGIQKGDRFDVEVRTEPRSETTSLHEGWLMRTRLREMAVLGGSIRTGDVTALADGPVLVESVFEGDEDNIHLKRGLVLGGGIARQSRPLGLTVHRGKYSIQATTTIARAINLRFHTFQRGIKKGVASPKNDRFIELAVHPRYKNNISRYVRVIGSIALREPSSDRIERIALLERQLLEPTTAMISAVRLEAIGKEAIQALQSGIKSADPEVRFYSAEALAYLDQAEAAEVLTDTARDEPAFRWHALTALAAMDHSQAYEGLSTLLHVDSAETRYGAFRALRARNPLDPLVLGAPLTKEYGYHPIPSTGEPMIHISRRDRAEIVLFGHDQTMHSPPVLFAGRRIMIKRIDDENIKVIHYSTGDETRVVECKTRLDEVLRAVISFGASYEEVLDFLREAKQGGYLNGRLVIDALPSPRRQYRRDKSQEDALAEGRQQPQLLPDLFQFHGQQSSQDNDDSSYEAHISDDDHQPQSGFFGRINRWLGLSGRGQ